jgi:hypothetical protein
MSQPWSVEAIKARILQRLSEVGKTLEDLPAGVRKGFEEGRWRNGPTIATLQATADILEITVPELLGAPLGKNAELDKRLVAKALRYAIEILAPADSECPLRLQCEMAGNLASGIYSLLAIMGSERPDLVYSDDGRVLLSIIRSLWQARDLEKS